MKKEKETKKKLGKKGPPTLTRENGYIRQSLGEKNMYNTLTRVRVCVLGHQALTRPGPPLQRDKPLPIAQSKQHMRPLSLQVHG